MKKVLIVLFLLLSFVSNSFVYGLEGSFTSEEFLDGIAYTKYNGKIRYFKNAKSIRNVDTGQVAYCIEPFSDLVNYSDYDGTTSYDSRFGISQEKWEKIKLYAYYGYGYYGHTEDKWISITQMSIWRYLYPEYEFNWLDNVKSRNVIYPYESELNELNKLVNDHYKYPSFDKEYTIGINEGLTIVDNNDVLKYYTLKKSDFNLYLLGDSIYIHPINEERDGEIVLERPKNIYSNNVAFYYSDSSQNIIQGGNLEQFDYSFKIKVVKGKITVNKIDSDSLDNNPQGNGSLDGAIFNLYDSNMNYITNGTILNGMLEFDNLAFGKYYVKEETPGVGYNINDKIYELNISSSNTSPSIEVENAIIKSKVTITKYYGTKEQFDNNSMDLEKGIRFDIYDSKNSLVFSGETDESGKIEVTLPYGDYVLKQFNTTLGYMKANDYSFRVDENNNYSSEIFLYDFKINVPNAYIPFYKVIRWNYA